MQLLVFEHLVSFSTQQQLLYLRLLASQSKLVSAGALKVVAFSILRLVALT